VFIFYYASLAKSSHGRRPPVTRLGCLFPTIEAPRGKPSTVNKLRNKDSVGLSPLLPPSQQFDL
jgi:hypothetical protein